MINGGIPDLLSASADRMRRRTRARAFVVEPGGRSESALATMLAAGSTDLNPLAMTGDIVRFCVETLAPLLLMRF